MRTLTGALVVLASALVVTPSTAGAAGATCHDQPATVVGADDQVILDGTPGPDVVVTGGAQIVNALAGDDLVCVTGDTVEVDAGTGDDLVDARQRPGDGRTVVGDGADTFLGGPGFDEVRTGGISVSGFYEDDHRDVIRTGPGGAHVTSGVGWDVANDDVLVLGRGGWVIDTNTISFWGRQGTDGRLHFGDGKGILQVGDASSGAGAWVVDNRERRISTGSTTYLTWTGEVSEFDVQLLEIPGGEGTSMSLRGTRRAETFVVSDQVSRLDAHTGRGGDLVALPTCNSVRRGTVDLGPGRDTVRTGCRDLVVRLDRGRLQPGVSVRGLESLEVGGSRVSVWGDDARNHVELQGCGGTVHGGGGADTVRVLRRGCGGVGVTLYGGRGDDGLSGSPNDDLLVGDLGRDVVDGKAGRDTCRAEVVLRCERH